MTRDKVVARARQLVESAMSGQPVEDSLTEFKAELPTDLQRAARQLGGHANAAAGQPVFWLVGVREDGEVIGAARKEVANWYPGLQAKFDGPPPRLSKCVNVPIAGRTVVAMVFDTDEPPYVLKKSDGSKEVPWRQGNSTRSSSRAELLGLLSDFVQLPEVDVLEAILYCTRGGSSVSPQLKCVLKALMYVKPRLRKPVTIPFHECRGRFTIPGLVPVTEFQRVVLWKANDYRREHIGHDLSIKQPMTVAVEAYGVAAGDQFESTEAEVEVVLPVVNATRSILLRRMVESRSERSSLYEHYDRAGGTEETDILGLSH